MSLSAVNVLHGLHPILKRLQIIFSLRKYDSEECALFLIRLVNPRRIMPALVLVQKYENKNVKEVRQKKMEKYIWYECMKAGVCLDDWEKQ